MKTVHIQGITFPISDSSSETFFMLDTEGSQFDPAIIEVFLKDEWLRCQIEKDGEKGEEYDAKLQSVSLFYDDGIKTNIVLRKKTELETLREEYEKLLNKHNNKK